MFTNMACLKTTALQQVIWKQWTVELHMQIVRILKVLSTKFDHTRQLQPEVMVANS